MGRCKLFINKIKLKLGFEPDKISMEELNKIVPDEIMQKIQNDKNSIVMLITLFCQISNFLFQISGLTPMLEGQFYFGIIY